jgi:transposase InsO family protein
VARLIERRGLSQRRACELVGIDHCVLRYRSKRPDDAPLRRRLRELAQVRRRFGYRRLGWLLAREGYALNHKRLYRLYREERLMVRRRRGRKRTLGTRVRRWNCPVRLINLGVSTSSPTRSPTAAACASCAWSTTSAASAWPRWPMAH